jgi:hypothetical protein
MPVLKIRSAIVVAAVCAAVAGCGSDDDSTAAPGSTPTSIAQATPPTPTVAEATETAKPAGTPAPTATPKGAKDKYLPHTTPAPGPPLPFTVAISKAAIEPNIKAIPPGKPLKVTLLNHTGRTIGVRLLSNGVPVGIARLEAGKDIFVLVRNLDPGKLVIESAGRDATVAVRAGA